MDMQGGVAIVTGSSSGVGAACAKRLAERGAHLVINYASNRDGAEATREACEAFGIETRIVQADVANDDDCRRMAKVAEETWGRCDALVNNAGTTVFCPLNDLEGLSSTDFQDIYAVNTIGAFQMSRAAAPIMRRGGRGSIVMVASIAGVLGIGSSIAYAASKGAMITLTKALARVLGPEIRVNVVCPGFIQGEWLRQGMGDAVYEASKNAIERTTPLGRTSTPDTVADSVLTFIESNDLVTGESLILDAGMHLTGMPTAR
ncbi:MAG: SDR family NAD(P)-dependent oxidoreductase [Gammaproteobacteria bacterium]|nr:SDR family NAD(P)-dependent oxidoreductase [Gammaproteobacteria bacterium]